MREDDANGDKDGACARSIGDGHFQACTFGIVITAAETDAALGQILADGDFFLEATAANTGKDTGFDPCTVAARNDALFDSTAGGKRFFDREFGLRLNPDGRGIAVPAKTGDTFSNFEGLELHLVEVDDFAALAKTTFHQEASEGFLAFVRSGEIDVPEVGAGIEDGNGVDETFGLAIDFRNNFGANGLVLIAIEFSKQGDFLAREELFLQTENAAITAHKKGLGILACGSARRGGPRGFDLQLQADAVALTNAFGDH